MPLYMDFHTISNITIEQVKNAHQAVQDCYHVKYLQCWMNEGIGTVFCLMEGPDKEACETVHWEAYGNSDCKIIEVQPGMYNFFMEENHQVDHRLYLQDDGIVDVGYRFVLVIDFTGNPCITPDDRNLKPSHKLKTLALGIINKFQGKEMKYAGDDRIIAVFMDADDAVRSAVEMHAELKEKSKDHKEDEWNILFKTGISGGQSVTGNEGSFEQAIRLAQRLSSIAENQQIVVTALAEKMSAFSKISGKLLSVRVISRVEEKFLDRLFDIVEDKLTDKNFSVESLGRDMGISRCQLYRKIIAIIGHSPNSFIRNLRMQKALSLIRKKQYNISEVALEVGIHNPSYFAKCFQEKYGIIPSRMMG